MISFLLVFPYYSVTSCTLHTDRHVFVSSHVGFAKQLTYTNVVNAIVGHLYIYIVILACLLGK